MPRTVRLAADETRDSMSALPRFRSRSTASKTLRVMEGTGVMTVSHEEETESREALAQGRPARSTQAEQHAVRDAGVLIRSFESVLRGAVGETIELLSVCECGSDSRGIDVDPVQFKAALLNLVVNASEAMPGGGRVEITCARVDIGGYDTARPRLAGGRYVAVTVSDSGAGIPSDAIDHVFEPFYTSKHDAPPGSGLGLCQVSGFAAQSGGGVGIVTELGKGTRVTIYLPLKSREDDPADGHRGASGATKTVLLVEDDEHVRRSTFHALDLLGYRVIEEANGPDALARLRSDGAIDILFTDVVMPGGMSGVMLAREARAMQPALAILLASGHRRDAIGAEPLDGFAFLAKPYQLRDLAEALRSVDDVIAARG
jgi:CheY-like chemotaxis protein